MGLGGSELVVKPGHAATIIFESHFVVLFFSFLTSALHANKVVLKSQLVGFFFQEHKYIKTATSMFTKL